MYRIEFNLEEMLDLLGIVGRENYEAKKYEYHSDELQKRYDRLEEKIRKELKKESQQD